MARERKQFPLRISPQLYEVYEAWAADEFRSVNAQIEAVLADAARRSGRLHRRPAPRPEGPAAGQADRDAHDRADHDPGTAAGVGDHPGTQRRADHDPLMENRTDDEP